MRRALIFLIASIAPFLTEATGHGELFGSDCTKELRVAMAPCEMERLDGQQQAPVFRSSTLLIVQTVVVRDKKGNPVEGLKAKDFVLTEDGRPQEIAFAEYQKLDAAPLGTTEIAPTVPTRPVNAAPSVTAVGETLAAVPVPGDTRYRNKRLIVLYIDLQSLNFFDEYRVFDSVRKYLDKSMTSADLVSIFVYDQSRVRMRIDFTDDRAALRRVLDDLEKATTEAEMGGNQVTFETGGAFGEDAGSLDMFSMDRRLAALQSTVTNLGPLPEMKTLIYFGGGLGTNPDNLAQMRATVNAAVRSNVTINPIDTRGLEASAPMGNASRPSPGGIGMFSGALAQAAVRRTLRSQDAYYAMAKDTGGKAMFDNNDLSMGITQAADAVTGYYMLGYYTTNLLKDGKYRRVKVSLAQPLADTELSYRSGYYGAKEWAKFNTYDKERHLQEALSLEDPITDIPMAVEVNVFQVSSAEYFVPVSVRMPGSELARPRPAGDTKADIDMVAEIKDEFGVTMRNSRDRLSFKLDSASATEVARKPLQYETGFTVLPGSYVVKVLARDATTGRIGTFLHPFVVPNLEKEKTRLPISTVVLSTQRVPPTDALYTVQQKISVTTANPLVEDGLRLIPSVTHTFSASVPLFLYLQAYERDSTSPRPVVAFATLYRDGVKVFETDAISATEWDAKTKAVAIRLSVAPGSLQPASYDWQVTVLDPSSNRSAFSRGALTIVK